jgi:DNA polymerase I-like protein with 3'-5' exonuclease and polymerase domains
MQNPPQAPGVRECFIPREGHAIVSVDFDAFEMRVWAQICLEILGFSDLAQVFKDPKRCPHVEMGARIRGLSLEDAYALKGKERKDLRGVAKGPNFGLPGGMGAARLVDYCRQNYGVIISLEFAQQAIQAWRQQWGEAGPYLKYISRLTANGRVTVQQMLPKHMGPGRYRGDVGYCDAANGFFQGRAADAATMAGNVLAERMYTQKSSPLYGCRLLAFVHDEWLGEIPLEGLHERAFEMARVQVEVAQEFCPDVPLTASPSAMMAWSKAAGDPVFRDGRLIPYEWRESA